MLPPVVLAGVFGLVAALLAAAGSTSIGQRFRADRSAASRGPHPHELLSREIARQWTAAPKDVPPPPKQLRVATLNTGLIAVTPLMAERLEMLLASDLLRKYDIVALQEVTLAADAARIVAKARELGLGFSHAFDGGVGIPFWPGCQGTGLLVLSRWPMQETIYRRYVVNGKPEHLHHYDYYGAKGTGLCRIALGGGSTLNLYVTHMHAAYNDNYADQAAGVADEYAQHRAAQALQMSEFIRSTSAAATSGGGSSGSGSSADLTLAVGDFNSLPTSLAMRTIHTLGGARRNVALLFSLFFLPRPLVIQFPCPSRGMNDVDILARQARDKHRENSKKSGVYPQGWTMPGRRPTQKRATSPVRPPPPRQRNS
jgi:endonuclease/exonuclease/phosphatase family metal-dependent hydrolase